MRTCETCVDITDKLDVGTCTERATTNCNVTVCRLPACCIPGIHVAADRSPPCGRTRFSRATKAQQTPSICIDIIRHNDPQHHPTQGEWSRSELPHRRSRFHNPSSSRKGASCATHRLRLNLYTISVPPRVFLEARPTRHRSTACRKRRQSARRSADKLDRATAVVAAVG